jgi:Tripartite tricarboxylate transporter family receptor
VPRVPRPLPLAWECRAADGLTVVATSGSTDAGFWTDFDKAGRAAGLGGLAGTLAGSGTVAKRTALLPDVPTLEESGISGVDLGTWWGIAGPAGMPANVVQALNAEIGKMLTSPELGMFLASEGAEAEAMTPQQFGDLMRLETERWTKVAHEANISID